MSPFVYVGGNVRPTGMKKLEFTRILHTYMYVLLLPSFWLGGSILTRVCLFVSRKTPNLRVNFHQICAIGRPPVHYRKVG